MPSAEALFLLAVEIQLDNGHYAATLWKMKKH